MTQVQLIEPTTYCLETHNGSSSNDIQHNIGWTPMDNAPLVGFTCGLFFAPQPAAIDVEWQVEALDKHTAAAFSTTRHAITLSSKETTQMRQVALQNQMALDTLTAAQGGSCALVKAQCCVHILYNSHNISSAMKALDGHISVIDSISINPISA